MKHDLTSLLLLCLLVGTACGAGSSERAAAVPEPRRVPGPEKTPHSVLPDNLVNTWPPEWEPVKPETLSPFGGTIQEAMTEVVAERPPLRFEGGDAASLGLSAEPMYVDWEATRDPMLGRYGVQRGSTVLAFQAFARLRIGDRPIGGAWLEMRCTQRLQCQLTMAEHLSEGSGNGSLTPYRAMVEIQGPTLKVSLMGASGQSPAEATWVSALASPDP